MFRKKSFSKSVFKIYSIKGKSLVQMYRLSSLAENHLTKHYCIQNKKTS